MSRRPQRACVFFLKASTPQGLTLSKNVTAIYQTGAEGAENQSHLTALQDVYFEGSEDEWHALTESSWAASTLTGCCCDAEINGANIHFNSTIADSICEESDADGLMSWGSDAALRNDTVEAMESVPFVAARFDEDGRFLGIELSNELDIPAGENAPFKLQNGGAERTDVMLLSDSYVPITESLTLNGTEGMSNEGQRLFR